MAGKITHWVIQGNYGNGWEEIDTVYPTDPEGAKPGELTGEAYADWLCNEYRRAHAPHPHRVRAVRG